MSFFKRYARRIVAGILALLLLPLPQMVSAADADDASMMTVICQDIYHQDNLSTVQLLRTETGYFITLENATQMLGLVEMGDRYTTPNGLVNVYPDTSKLDKVQYEDADWYALDQLMTELDTTIISANGQLCYSCTPINQSLLVPEVSRIMTNSGYNAYMLQDLPGLPLLTSFAFAFDALWNRRVDVLTGEAYADDVSALLLESLLHHDDNGSFAKLMSEKLDGLEDICDLILLPQENLELVYEMIQEPMPGAYYLLFGIEGTGTLRDFLQIGRMAGDAGISISDILNRVAQLNEIGKVPAMYANALERVLDAAETENLPDKLIMRQADEVLDIYNAHLEDNALVLVEKSMYLNLKDIINNVASDQLLPMSPLTLIAQKSIEILDEVPGNPLGNTFKKNSFVKNSAIAVHLQTFLRKVFNSHNVSDSDGASALVLRDATMLYLNIIWTVYENASFDGTLAASIRMAQQNIDNELLLLAGFHDGMFCEAINDPIPLGSLSYAPGYRPDTDVSDQNSHREIYMEFLRQERYVNYIQFDVIREFMLCNNYTFHDLDFDGREELIVWLGAGASEGELMTFTLDGNTVRYYGSVFCLGICPHVMVSDHDWDIIIAEISGGELYTQNCRFVNNTLTTISTGTEIPHGWYELEWLGDIPQGTAQSSGNPFREFITNESYVFYIETPNLYNQWMAGNTRSAYWLDDMDNDGTDELLVWMADSKNLGEVLAFRLDGEPCYLGSFRMPGNSPIRISGNPSIPGTIISTNDGMLELLLLCTIRANGTLQVETNYMPSDPNWLAVEAGN